MHCAVRTVYSGLSESTGQLCSAVGYSVLRDITYCVLRSMDCELCCAVCITYCVLCTVLCALSAPTNHGLCPTFCVLCTVLCGVLTYCVLCTVLCALSNHGLCPTFCVLCCAVCNALSAPHKPDQWKRHRLAGLRAQCVRLRWNHCNTIRMNRETGGFGVQCQIEMESL